MVRQGGMHEVRRFAALRPVAWKNGGGTTADVAVHPEGAALDAFDWRVSLARMTADGPFSGFPGVDRTLVVAEGAGLSLMIGSQPARRLVRTSPPFSFPGDASCRARLRGGPVLNLNVMTRRALFDHAVTRWALTVPRSFTVGSVGLVACLDGTVTVAGDTLQPYDTVLLPAAASVTVAPAGGAAAVVAVVAIEPRAGR